MTDLLQVSPLMLQALPFDGQISDDALVAIAPIAWLQEKYFGLINTPEKMLSAVKATKKSCGSCFHFSSVHHCCLTRLDEDENHLSVDADSDSCLDFEGC